jgi:hypothetical protein
MVAVPMAEDFKKLRREDFVIWIPLIIEVDTNELLKRFHEAFRKIQSKKTAH